jgi:hypothetical protein
MGNGYLTLKAVAAAAQYREVGSGAGLEGVGYAGSPSPLMAQLHRPSTQAHPPDCWGAIG